MENNVENNVVNNVVNNVANKGRIELQYSKRILHNEMFVCKRGMP